MPISLPWVSSRLMDKPRKSVASATVVEDLSNDLKTLKRLGSTSHD